LFGKEESTFNKREEGFQMLAKIMKWVSIGALVAMSWRPAANYQLLLSFVVCMGAIIVVQEAVQAREYLWGAGFVGLALLFNPILPVFKPSGNLLRLVVLVCIAPFALSLAALKTQPVLSIPSITDRNPGSESL